jgi:hypothetical protein
MKVVILKVPTNCADATVGNIIECTGAKLDELLSAGVEYETVEAHEAKAKAKQLEDMAVQARESTVQRAIDSAIAKGSILPAEDVKDLKAKAVKMEEFSVGMGVEHIERLPVKAKDRLSTRRTTGTEGEVATIQAGEQSFRDTFKEYVTASEPFAKTIRAGGILGRSSGKTPDEAAKIIVEATELSRKKTSVVSRIGDMIKAGADYRWEDIVKAADYVDPAANNPLGTLNTDLLLNFNLGHLEAQLAMLDDITTDISDQPVRFQQTALTRYIIVPGFQAKASGVAWAPGTGATVDVNVQMANYIGAPLAWNENYLGATTRNFPNEFRTAQLYSIGQAIIYYLINTGILGSTRINNNGTASSTIKANAKSDGSTAGLPFKLNPNNTPPNLLTFTSSLPASMDLAQFPGGDEDEDADPLRFAWVHTTVYAAAVTPDLILNQTLQRMQNKLNPNAMVTGKINRLGNITFRKSQLMTDQNTLTADPNNASSQVVTPGQWANATTVGLGGTRSGLIFTSRLPIDYTKLLDVQGGFATEVVTSQKLGIKLLVIKYLDHAYETANMRVQIMFGTAIGDERQLMLLNQK